MKKIKPVVWKYDKKNKEWIPYIDGKVEILASVKVNPHRKYWHCYFCGKPASKKYLGKDLLGQSWRAFHKKCLEKWVGRK